MYLADEAWPDPESHFESASLAMVPLGSTERHGPCLPEGADHIIVESFARAAAPETGHRTSPMTPSTTPATACWATGAAAAVSEELFEAAPTNLCE